MVIVFVKYKIVSTPEYYHWNLFEFIEIVLNMQNDLTTWGVWTQRDVLNKFQGSQSVVDAIVRRQKPRHHIGRQRAVRRHVDGGA